MKNNINYNINDNAINDNAINENINFFIDLKLNVNDLINASNRLIINHEQNEEFINNNNNNKKLLIEYSNVAKDIKNKIDKLKTLLEMTTNYIQNNCKHQIEHDYIDISPDKMINISYCTICGNNFT